MTNMHTILKVYPIEVRFMRRRIFLFSLMVIVLLFAREIQAVTVPILVSPPSGATVFDTTVSFVWTTGDGNRWNLEVLESDGSIVFDDTVTDNGATFKISDGKYLWRVQACDDGICSEWSDHAILAVSIPVASGNISGIITDSESGMPIGGAQIKIEGVLVATSHPDGAYMSLYPAGTYTFTASALGYVPTEQPGIEVLDYNTTQQDFELVPRSDAGTINGHITAANCGVPVVGAEVTTDSERSTTSNKDGTYSMVLPAGALTVTAEAYCYTPMSYSGVVVSEGNIVTQDFALTIIENQPPTASFSAYPTSGNEPLTVSFDATASNDPDGTIISYYWDFGDSNLDLGETTSHEYTSAGIYTVTLTVTDDDNFIDTDTTMIIVTGDDYRCFIRLAVSGSPIEPCINILRKFRDRFLKNNTVGRAFVDLYYTSSPSATIFIANHGCVRALVRWSLLPFVGVSWIALNIGLLPALIFMFLFGFGFVGIAGFTVKKLKE